jgi:hypothetical protein
LGIGRLLYSLSIAFCVGIALQHFLGSSQPPSEPILRAALGHPHDVRPELPAQTDGVTGDALARSP